SSQARTDGMDGARERWNVHRSLLTGTEGETFSGTEREVVLLLASVNSASSQARTAGIDVGSEHLGRWLLVLDLAERGLETLGGLLALLALETHRRDGGLSADLHFDLDDLHAASYLSSRAVALLRMCLSFRCQARASSAWPSRLLRSITS